jgi:hypothetical protein
MVVSARIVVAVCLVAASVVAYQWHASREVARFIAAKKAEYSGYRLTHIEPERRLFLHRPDGSRDGVDMGQLRRVHLYRLDGGHTVDGQVAYFWRIDGPPMHLLIPYFAVEPRDVLEIVRRTHPEVDLDDALRYTRDFERGAFHFCTLWAPPGVAELEPERGYRVCERP